MLERKGFTLVELMVVILIVAILAAVAIPIMRGRIDSAKWTEGKAMAGTIATAIRAYSAEMAENGNYGTDAPTLAEMGFAATDLDGTYFKETGDNAFGWTTLWVNPNILTYTITIKAPASIGTPTSMSLDNFGEFKDTSVGGP